MRNMLLAWLAAGLATAAAAQAPVEDVKVRDHAVERSQRAASAAYRELEQARYDGKLAEQDYVNALEAQRTAQKHAGEMKARADAAKIALDAARAKEAQARKRYDAALKTVDQAFRPAGAGK